MYIISIWCVIRQYDFNNEVIFIYALAAINLLVFWQMRKYKTQLMKKQLITFSRIFLFWMFINCWVFLSSQGDAKEIEKREEAKLKSMYPQLNRAPGGGSALLHKRLQHKVCIQSYIISSLLYLCRHCVYILYYYTMMSYSFLTKLAKKTIKLALLAVYMFWKQYCMDSW